MLKISENNGMKKIGLVTPTPDLGFSVIVILCKFANEYRPHCVDDLS